MTKILIDGPAWVGDMVMAQVLFKLLKQQNPGVQIDVMAPAWTKALLQCMPEINTALVTPFQHGDLALSKRYKFARQLRAADYDRCILLRNSLKSALIPFWAKVQKRSGWLGEYRYGLVNDVRKLNKSRYPLMIERFAALAFASNSALPSDLPKPKLCLDQALRSEIATKFALDSAKPVIAFCPGAEFGPSKQWPAGHFAAVAKAKLQQGFDVWLFGSKKDEAVSAAIQAATQQKCHNFVGRTSLLEAIYLLDFADCVVTNDSGLMHISAALDKPIVAVYGGSSYEFTPPLCDKKILLKTDMNCRPCFKRECQFGHYNCLNKVSADDVLQSINELLA